MLRASSSPNKWLILEEKLPCLCWSVFRKLVKAMPIWQILAPSRSVTRLFASFCLLLLGQCWPMANATLTFTLLVHPLELPAMFSAKCMQTLLVPVLVFHDEGTITRTTCPGSCGNHLFCHFIDGLLSGLAFLC